MSKKDVLHIPIPEVPPPDRTAHPEDEHAPPAQPSEDSERTPSHTHHHTHIIEPQPSSIPYPGVGVS